MFATLSSRVAGMAVIVIVALASLAGLLADVSHETGASFRWVVHSAEVIETTEAALDALRHAESGQRGLVITRDPAYAAPVADQLARSRRDIARTRWLTRDNALQSGRAVDLARLMDKRARLIQRTLQWARAGNFTGAAAVISSGRGRALMESIDLRAALFLEEERRLRGVRGAEAETRVSWGLWVAVIGASLVALIVIAGFALLTRALRRPLAAMLQAMDAVGVPGIVDADMGSREFSRLAHGYNAMVRRLALAVSDQADSEQRLQVANVELQRNGVALQERGAVIELLGGMAHRMQAARTDAELAQIVRVFAPRVLPNMPGALYAHNNSRNLLVPIADWGGLVAAAVGFAPDQCWALRRGRSHGVFEAGGDVVCEHAEPGVVYHCEPLLAGGEVIGVLYLLGRVEDEGRYRLTLLAENIASALVNHRLHRSLREQTIRDPLTGLFNRRYMEEALTLEIARAARSGAPLSLVMCDVDHFKRFNDEFGHDAGDAVLKAVATEMRSRFRDGDVVCRFGGEEFTVIAPETSADALLERVEAVRQAIADLDVRQGGRLLGSTSMSFGLATWNRTMARDGSTLIQAADTALYQAKREGRNRALIGLRAA